MKAKSRQSAFTLPEMTVVAAIISLLAVFSMPAIRAFFDSAVSSPASARPLISAALSSARAIAAKEQHYAGIRFQQDTDGNQYIIFIIHDFQNTGIAPGFRAVHGIKPIKLRDNICIMEVVTDPAELDTPGKLTDRNTFSVVFSPSGSLVTQLVRVLSLRSSDPIFNDLSSTDAMFQEDSNITPPPQKELSRHRFIVYDKTILAALNDTEGLNYLVNLEPIRINPYTGTIISMD